MTEYRPGDRIAIVDRREFVVAKATETHIYTMSGGIYSLRRVGYPTCTRTIEVIERAPLPWQDGDVAYDRSIGQPFVVVRDGGLWFYATGGTAFDDNPERAGCGHWTALIRGGKRVQA